MPRKSMDWFLYDNDLRHERVKKMPCISALYMHIYRNSMACDWDQITSLQILRRRQIKADNADGGGTIVEKKENLCSSCSKCNDWQECGWKHRQGMRKIFGWEKSSRN